jgi:hypothetical protein
MRTTMLKADSGPGMDTPWIMHVQGIAIEEPDRLVRNLSAMIVGSGGWILSRGMNDTGTVTLLFEFERHSCVEIYSGVVGAGVELSRSGHLRFTELCQCTRSCKNDCQAEIATVELEIKSYPLAAEPGKSASTAV